MQYCGMDQESMEKEVAQIMDDLEEAANYQSTLVVRLLADVLKLKIYVHRCTSSLKGWVHGNICCYESVNVIGSDSAQAMAHILYEKVRDNKKVIIAPPHVQHKFN